MNKVNIINNKNIKLSTLLRRNLSNKMTKISRKKNYKTMKYVF